MLMYDVRTAATKTSAMDMVKTINKEEAHMKKVLGILLASVIALTSLTALAEAIDFSDYNDTALIELLASVQQEIANRHIEKSASLPQGTYLVGKDIPAGSYDISVVYKGAMWMDVYIYSDAGSKDAKHDFTVFSDGDYGDGTGSFHVDLAEGEVVKCTAPITLTISAGVMFR